MTITYGGVRATLRDVCQESLSNPIQIRLSPKSVLGLAGRRHGLTIQCHGGELWLTQQGDATDYLLSAGDTFVTDRRGRIVVQALTGALVSVSPTDC